MASINTINLYKHYLEIAPKKAKQAAVLLERFPELAEKPKVEQKPEKVNKEVKSDGKKPKR